MSWEVFNRKPISDYYYIEDQATEIIGMRGIQISRSYPLLDPGDPGAIV
jgi:hypothetical protein